MSRRIAKILAGLLVAFLVWICTTGVMIWNYGKEDHSNTSDCIIVLGAAAYGTKPSPVFEERIKHAIYLFQQGHSSTLIFTGGRGEGASHAESEVGAAYAIAAGVPEAAILTETESRTTQQNLVKAQALMVEAGLKTSIIVSDPLHLKRASIMAEDLRLDAVTSPTPTSRYRTLWTKLGFLLREVYFYHHYIVTGE